MEPANHPTQSLVDLLNAITGLISQYFIAHSGVYDNVVGGIVLATLVFLFPLVQKRVALHFWRFIGWLGSKRGFYKLALGAYRRELVTEYGTFYRSHAPAWECSLYRSCGSIPRTLERHQRHSHAERHCH